MSEMPHKPYKTVQIAEEVFVDVCNANEFTYKGSKLTSGLCFVIRWETTDAQNKPLTIKMNLREATFDALRNMPIDTKFVGTLYK